MSAAAILGALLLALAGAGGAYWQGRQDGRATCEAELVRDMRVATLAADAAASAAAQAIGKISVRHTTIRQEAEREILTRIEYRDCRHSADQLQRINAALTDTDRAQPAAAGELPSAAAADD